MWINDLKKILAYIEELMKWGLVIGFNSNSLFSLIIIEAL